MQINTATPPNPKASHLLSPTDTNRPRRPLSQELPSRDVLYLFSNFSSYMRSPHEGAEGIGSSADFRDTIRLLEYARACHAVPNSNVYILHLKYRYNEQAGPFFSPYLRQVLYKEKESAPDGVKSAPVPQPFSVLDEPVLKIDYKNDGIFDPLPAQAIFRHMAKNCQPLPRTIVISYVASHATQNHLASLAAWAAASNSITHAISPIETRLRESKATFKGVTLISMYAKEGQGSETGDQLKRPRGKGVDRMALLLGSPAEGDVENIDSKL